MTMIDHFVAWFIKCLVCGNTKELPGDWEIGLKDAIEAQNEDGSPEMIITLAPPRRSRRKKHETK